MHHYRTPGVHFEWQERVPFRVQPVRTDVAGFIGIARRGPLHEPVRIESWTQFEDTFGGHTHQGYLAYAVQGFFANGGRSCFVVRVADPEWARKANLDLLGPQGEKLRLTAASEGEWAHQLAVTVRRTGDDRYTLTLELPTGERENWRDLSLSAPLADDAEPDPTAARYLVDVLNGRPRGSSPDRRAGSRLVRAEALGPGQRAENPLRIDAAVHKSRLAGGRDGVWTLRPSHLSGEHGPAENRWGLATLERVPEVGIVAIPDMMPAPFVSPRKVERRRRCEQGPAAGGPRPAPPKDPDHPPSFTGEEVWRLQQALVRHCERLADRMALLNGFPDEFGPADLIRLRSAFQSSYAALYHPWLRMPDPLSERGELRLVPPCGHVAGVYARVEWQTGVHTPPANEPLESVKDLRIDVDETGHGYLNDHHVNVVRAVPGRGLRVMGSRTLSLDPNFRFVNVRRLLIMIERAIKQQTQWLTFEPNRPQLWGEVDRVMRGFLEEVWRRGMLDGATADEAYQVTCDLTTNPPEETERGFLTTLIEVRAPWPAEVVVVHVRRNDRGTQFQEERRDG